MTKDIGIVLLPNKDCKNFASHMTAETAKALPSCKEAVNNPHITLIHIANLNDNKESELKQAFHEFCHNLTFQTIPLPIKGINATGGSAVEGYKWLDLQFEILPDLAELRQGAIDSFCPFHNGILTRMNDDIQSFTHQQMEQIEKCGVTYGNYLPHITAWYIDLPSEPKITQLQDIANVMANEIDDLNCYAESIALVELGRNGNSMNIITQHPLNTQLSGTYSDISHIEL